MYYLSFFVLLLFPAQILCQVECPSLFIRFYSELKNLDNCTAILGNLNIAFTLEEDRYKADQINARRFPLREITGFFMLYSVEHLNSLGFMFPNLTVVRGTRLMRNAAFIIYDNFHLSELNLRNLLRINRGSMRIAGSNPLLCLPKIDWSSIITNGRLFYERKSVSTYCQKLEKDTCHTCPMKDKCWSNQACQRFESSYYPVDLGRRAKCHPLCLGQCVNTTAKGCFACRDISEDYECVEACSPDKVLHVEFRRCITKQECAKQKRFILGEDCIQNCSIAHKVRNDTGISYCDSCYEDCEPKSCVAADIKHLASLEDYPVGCTIIDGDLEISITDDVSNVTAELHKYFGDVESINGSLKIYRSTSITSLTFLNKLRYVRGSTSDHEKYSIRIFENFGLQSIFDWKTREQTNLTLVYGSIQLTNNMMLCIEEVQKFRNHVIYGQKGANMKDLLENNGYKKICLNKLIVSRFHVWSDDSCAIYWRDLNATANQKPNAYLIQYVAIDPQSLADNSYLLERDSCASKGWKHVVLKQEDLHTNADNFHVFNLTGLNQFTYYAFSIQTYYYESENISKLLSEVKTGISEVKKFRTSLYAPSRVKGLKATGVTTNSITVKWNINENEHDAIGNFYIDLFTLKEDTKKLDLRDFCRHPFGSLQGDYEIKEKEDDKAQEEDYDIVIEGEKCCDKCCRIERERQTRMAATGDSDFGTSIGSIISKPRKILHRYEDHRNDARFVERQQAPSDLRNFTIGDLNAFTRYRIVLFACTSEGVCGDYEMITQLTLANPSYDRVQPTVLAYNDKSHQFNVHFYEPTQVNGNVLNFVIEYRRGNSTGQTECITRLDHENNGHIYTIYDLSEGDYEFRVKATSLAGDGQWQEWQKFEIYNEKEIWPEVMTVVGIFAIVVVLALMAITYYYKHKISLLIKRDDRTHLLKDIAPVDFQEILLNRGDSDDEFY